MLLKLSGCVLIFFSSFLFGRSFKVSTKRRLLSLENMLSCMQYFETEIRFSMNDIICATEKILKIAVSDNALLFKTFLDNAQNTDGRALSEIWKSTVEKTGDKLSYDKDDLKVITEFGTALGSGDVENQIKNVERLCLSLRENIDYVKNKASKSDDVFSKLGIYTGALLVIFLI